MTGTNTMKNEKQTGAVEYDIPANVQRMNIDFENRVVEFVPGVVPGEVSETWVPKDGDVVFDDDPIMSCKNVAIYKDNNLCYARLFLSNNDFENGSIVEWAKLEKPSDEQVQRLFTALAERGLKWNAEEKRIEKVRWRAAEGEEYWGFYREGVSEFTDSRDGFDNSAYNNGMYFRTQAEAQSAFEQVKQLLTKIHESK